MSVRAAAVIACADVDGIGSAAITSRIRMIPVIGEPNMHYQQTPKGASKRPSRGSPKASPYAGGSSFVQRV